MNIIAYARHQPPRKAQFGRGAFYRCAPDWDFTDDFEVENVSITDNGGTIKLFSGASAFPDIVTPCCQD